MLAGKYLGRNLCYLLPIRERAIILMFPELDKVLPNPVGEQTINGFLRRMRANLSLAKSPLPKVQKFLLGGVFRGPPYKNVHSGDA
jgi:hypothetical protein